MTSPYEKTSTTGVSYADSGVDIKAGDHAVELMRASVARTRRSEVVGSLGGFAGLFDASALARYARPLLATSTDGVGTKVEIARRMGVHDTIGYDLVGMVVDDLVVCGAEPLFMTDYICAGRVVPETIADVVKGIADACAATGTALVGGETAEHPGLLAPDAYDVAGAATGVVEAAALLGPERVEAGDLVIAMASSGLHSNGYSLVRHVVDAAGWELDREIPELGRTIGAELLEATRLYTSTCLAVLDDLGGRTAPCGVHAYAHVTGGGLAGNLARVIPAGLRAEVDRATWTPPAVFDLVGRLGPVSRADLELTLNQGVGMLAVVAATDAERVVSLVEARGIPAWLCGEVRSTGADAGSAETAVLVGEHRSDRVRTA